jgi:hypothetical protein
MAIPIEQSFLYVEPVYLQASQESTPQVETAGRRARSSMRRPERPTLSVALPELKRVIVAYGNEVVMKEDLVSALAAIFKEMEIPRETMPGEKVEKKSVEDLAVGGLGRIRGGTRQNGKDTGGACSGRQKRFIREVISLWKRCIVEERISIPLEICEGKRFLRLTILHP